jgi:hypothetical protein
MCFIVPKPKQNRFSYAGGIRSLKLKGGVERKMSDLIYSKAMLKVAARQLRGQELHLQLQKKDSRKQSNKRFTDLVV